MKKSFLYSTTLIAFLLWGTAVAQVGDTDSFLGIKLGAPISSSFEACGRPANSATTPCYIDDGSGGYMINLVPNLGFSYDLNAGIENEVVSEVLLSTANANAPLLLRLLTLRFGKPSKTFEDFMYAADGSGISRVVRGNAWEGGHVAIYYQEHDPYREGNVAVMVLPMGQARKFDERAATSLEKLAKKF